MAIWNSFFSLLLLTSCAQVESRSSKPQAPKPEPYQEVSQTPAAAVKRKKQVLVILGPGAMNAAAHIGVLKSFDQLRIKIDKIIGIEWASIIAALYARNQKANEVEWKFFKLQDSEIKRTSLIGRNTDLSDTSKLDSFLHKSFDSHLLEASKLHFACPTYSLKRRSARWLRNGPAKRELKKCLAFPPLFKDYQSWLSVPAFALNQNEMLEDRENQYVVLVDVIAGIDSKGIDENAEVLLWQEYQVLLEQMRKQVDFYIPVAAEELHQSLQSHKKELMRLGQAAAHPVLKKLKNQLNN